MKIIASTFVRKVKHAAKALKKPLSNFTIPHDVVQFSSNIKPLKQTKNSSEVKKLVRLFQDSTEHSVKGSIGSENKIKSILHKINRRFLAIPYEVMAKDSDAVTAVIKNKNNKVIGGYSMLKQPNNLDAELGIFVITPELKNTRASKQMLISMVKDIYEKASANDICDVCCTVNKNNKSAVNLLNKLNPHVMAQGNSLQYSISIQNLKTFIDNYSNLISRS